MDTVVEDILGVISSKLDVKSATNLFISSKKSAKKVIKYTYPRIWFNYNDIINGKCKKEDYKYIHKLKNVNDIYMLEYFINIRKIKFLKYRSSFCIIFKIRMSKSS